MDRMTKKVLMGHLETFYAYTGHTEVLAYMHEDTMEDLVQDIEHHVEFRPIDPDNPVEYTSLPLVLELPPFTVYLNRSDKLERGVVEVSAKDPTK